jgi:hypothetical protein
VQVNGQHDCVTDVQINYLNHGGGSKDADKLIDEIVVNLAQQLQGEMVVVFMFDNCAIGKNDEISGKLVQAFTDRGLCSVCEAGYFRLYHGKFKSDTRFGGYEMNFRDADIWGLDCVARAIERKADTRADTGLDFAHICDPIRQSNYDRWLSDQYTSLTDQSIKFGFTRRALHHFVSVAKGALERLSTPARTAMRATGELVTIPENFLVMRYKCCFKGDGWLACATAEAMSASKTEDILFFYMRQRDAKPSRVRRSSSQHPCPSPPSPPLHPTPHRLRPPHLSHSLSLTHFVCRSSLQ